MSFVNLINMASETSKVWLLEACGADDNYEYLNKSSRLKSNLKQQE